MSDLTTPQKNLNTLEQMDNDGSVKTSPLKQPGSPNLKAKNDLNMKSSFVTATNIVGKVGFAEKSKLNDVYDYHDTLNGLVDNLDSKVRILLNENQTNFLMAYKEQMMHIQKELKALKKKIDEETYKRKNDERMNILEQERDWFRTEAIRLDKVCKEQQRVLTELKFKLKLTNEDKNYYEEFVLTAKKENKALKEELLQFELGKKSVEDLPTLMQQTKNTSGKKKNLELGKNSYTPKKMREPEDIPDDYDEENLAENDIVQRFSVNEEKLLDIIKQMKIELDKEKKTVRQLRQEKSQMMVRRIELEQILVESINEVKRDIAKRRNNKTYKDYNKGPQVPQDIDITKFSATDKKNLLEYFLSNEMVLEELYSLVFSTGGTGGSTQQTYTPADGERHYGGQANTFSTTKSEGKLKYTFNYGFGSASNVRLAPKDLENVAISRKAQNLMDMKRDGRRPESLRRDL